MFDNILDEYCIYLRKSRTDLEAEARGEGETLARHEKTLLELSRRLKISIKKIYREIVSGETIAERPVMQKVLSEVEDGIWKGVLVMEVERLARGDTSDQGTVAQSFKYSNTKIITPMKTYDPNDEYDEEYFEFGLFMSRREFKTINRRLQRGRMSSVNEGKYLGSIAPYGYARYKLVKEKGYSLEIIEEEAEVVKMIFDWYVNGKQMPDGTIEAMGTSLIAHELNILQIPSAKGGLWVTETINTIIRNPVYMGKIKWGSRPLKKKKVDGKIVKTRPRMSIDQMILIPGRHEAIVTEALWIKANEKLALNPSKPISPRKKISNPLASIMICGKCNRRLIRRPYPNRNDTLMCPVKECKNVSSELILVESRIMEGLKNWLASYKADWENRRVEKKEDTQVDLLGKAIKKIEKDIADLQTQLDNLHDLLEQKVYTVEKFLDRSQIISEKIKNKVLDKESLLNKLNDNESQITNKEIVIPKLEHVLDIYYKTDDPALKNELLQSVIEKVVYTKEKGARWHGSLDDFEIKIFPKLPRTHH
ncbi:recombinase family protein [Paenibacillus polymyxa]|uniref:recombinase family protein n=1 Tax=Paenibacillus polymyxa TaxID=1406 RepID=UPI000EC27FF6|nr:recombinase family protein [Paenibacillus polymyxa]RGL39109.1 recombinase family protein [Paenibacillus polymyxa]WHX37357.1 recombinase family protein [Paenibacillus polymyxa]